MINQTLKIYKIFFAVGASFLSNYLNHINFYLLPVEKPTRIFSQKFGNFVNKMHVLKKRYFRPQRYRRPQGYSGTILVIVFSNNFIYSDILLWPLGWVNISLLEKEGLKVGLKDVLPLKSNKEYVMEIGVKNIQTHYISNNIFVEPN